MTRRRPARTAREIVLTVGAVFGVLCIVLTVAGAAFGLRPLLFRSGSMAPTINAGDLAMSRTVDASRLLAGDIVSVINSQGQRVTHRVVNIDGHDGTRDLTLKGDANQAPDVEVYAPAKVQKVLFNIPKAGYVVAAAASPVGTFTLGLYVAGMLLLAFGGSGTDGGSGAAKPTGVRPRRRREAGGRQPRSAAMVMVAVGLAATPVLASTSAWAAPWTDSVPVSGTQLTAYTVPKPVLTITSCAVKGNSVTGFTATVTWSAATNPYTPTYSAVLAETGDSRPVMITGTTRSATVTSSLLGSLLGTTVHLNITASLGTTPAWKSVIAVQPMTIALLGLTFTCGTPY